MKLKNPDLDFVIIGENIHTTRVVMRRGKLVTTTADGRQAVRYRSVAGERRQLVIPEAVEGTQDFEEGRVKHVKIAVQAAMGGDRESAAEGMHYLRRMVQRQEQAGADFLDLNVDEISLKLEEQKQAMAWLVTTVQGLTDIPVSVDSSNAETISVGLRAWDGSKGRPMLNSASLERLDALDLAVEHDAHVIVTAAGESGMPESAEERIANASRMVDAALEKGIAADDIYIDPLIFPISVDGRFGRHSFEAIAALRQKYGPEIHITGGMSNVSFGIPSRKWINDVFMVLAVEAGADSGIIDPVTSRPDKVFALDRGSRPYRLADDVLMGRDEHCAAYIAAWRRGELGDGGPPRRRRPARERRR